MKQRALTLDHIPMFWGGSGAQDLRGACLEIRDDGIHRHATSRDENAGLTGRAEVDREAPLGKRPRKGERGVLLAECTIGTNGEEALPRALAAGCNGYRTGRYADVDESATGAHRCVPQLRHVTQLRVQPADEIESRSERLDEERHPALSDHAAGVGNPDDESPRAPGVRFLRSQPRESRGDRRSFTRPLADAPFRHPVAQAESGLRKGGLGRIAEKKEIRGWELQRCDRRLHCGLAVTRLARCSSKYRSAA